MNQTVDGTGAFNGWRLVTPLDEVELYNTDGQLLSVTNRDGQTQTLTYNPNGHLTNVQDARGRTITLSYQQYQGGGPSSQPMVNLLTSVTLPDGTSYQYSYTVVNSKAYLQTVKSPGATGTVTRTYVYGEGSNGKPYQLTGIVDENTSRYATWQYDASGRAWLSVHGGVNDTTDRVELTFNGDIRTTLTATTSAKQWIDVAGTTTSQRTYGFSAVLGVVKQASSTQPCAACGTASAAQSQVYDAAGYPQSTTDFNGRVTNYTYDDTRGLETQRIEANGTSAQRTTNTVWNANFRVPDSRTVVNASGVTESLTKWAYNTRGQVLFRCEIDPANATASSYTCGASANAPTGVRQTSYTYCEQAGVTAGTCPLVGLALTVTGPRTDVSSVTTYTYYQTTDTSGCATPGGACHYLGDLNQVTNALNQSTTYISYDKNGRVTRQSDANGTLTDFTYHPRGWLLTRTVRANANGSASANDATTTFGYDNVGQVTQITQPDGAYLAYTYDAAHRLTDIADNLNNTIHYTLDATGNRTKEDTKDPSATLKRTLSRQYDQLSHLTQTLNALSAAVQTYQNPAESAPSGITYTNGYDGNGNAIYSVDGNGVGTEQQYDPLNRLFKTLQDHAGTGTTKDTTTQYAYDARDNLRSVTDPDGLVTGYTYDGLNNLTQLQSPDTGTSGYSYDAAGNRITQTDARGITATYAYDALNRLTGISYPSSSITYSYDEADGITGCTGSYRIGRLTTMTDSSGTTHYCYDWRGNLTQMTQETGGGTATTAYVYTLADRVSFVIYPSGMTVGYDRDATGRITAITWMDATPITLVSGISYAPFGPMKTITFGNGRTLSKSYDQDYAISQIASSDPNGLALQAGVDGLGNLTSASAGATARSYHYDPLYRLTQVQDGSANTLEGYSYNNTGDRLSKTRNGGTDTYAYSSPLTSHRLLNVAGTARTVDANGNTTQIGTDTFVYDERNRLVQAGGYEYDYNGKGERVTKVVQRTQGGGGSSVRLATPSGQSTFITDLTTFVYSLDGKLLNETETTTMCQGMDRQTCTRGPPISTTTEYVWADAILVGVVRDGNLYYAETDQLGTPRRVIAPGDTAATDEVVWSWDALGSAFGEHMPDEDPSGSGDTYTMHLRFPGQYFDSETGLNYNYFRDYEPATGRYLQFDPIGLDGGINGYGYVGANPLAQIDPFGLCKPGAKLQKCLEKIFGKPIGGIDVHNKKVMSNDFITTRRNEIRLPPDFPCDDFFNNPFLVLHEYYHVLEQWNTGELSVLKYAWEWSKHGSSDGNKYEDAANQFAREHLDELKKCLAENCSQ
ncbi:MAG: RHS repeat-associated core domain-containing protein [Rudaea sp.]|uniref:RHS repeat-associated core domain-containing protein n=1 Tax=Rudaea sp. TaxID=2136325 RepID=UPI0039E590E6